MTDIKQEALSLAARSIHGPCACREWCGDVHQDEDDPAMPVCKGLPVHREPLVEIVLVHRDGA